MLQLIVSNFYPSISKCLTDSKLKQFDYLELVV